MNIHHKREDIIQINVSEINKLQNNNISKIYQYLHHNRIMTLILQASLHAYSIRSIFRDVQMFAEVGQ